MFIFIRYFTGPPILTKLNCEVYIEVDELERQIFSLVLNIISSLCSIVFFVSDKGNIFLKK